MAEAFLLQGCCVCGVNSVDDDADYRYQEIDEPVLMRSPSQRRTNTFQRVDLRPSTDYLDVEVDNSNAHTPPAVHPPGDRFAHERTTPKTPRYHFTTLQDEQTPPTIRTNTQTVVK